MGAKDDGTMRSFATGATRDTSEGKIDMEGFTHPMVMKQFAKYMRMNQLQSDGNLRSSDNWQKGIDIPAYVKSLRRHHDDCWAEHRGFKTEHGLIAALCGVMFNSMGWLLEELKKRDFKLQDFDGDEPTPEMAERQRKVAIVARNENLCSYTSAWSKAADPGGMPWKMFKTPAEMEAERATEDGCYSPRTAAWKTPLRAAEKLWGDMYKRDEVEAEQEFVNKLYTNILDGTTPAGYERRVYEDNGVKVHTLYDKATGITYVEEETKTEPNGIEENLYVQGENTKGCNDPYRCGECLFMDRALNHKPCSGCIDNSEFVKINE